MTANGIKAALNLSSGYHNPLRLLRHLITVWSEIRPTMVAPTVEKKKKRSRDHGLFVRIDLRTHATDARR